MKDPVIFWFNNPPRVGKGAFNYLANNWEEDVIYVFLNDFRQERKQANWDDGDFGKAKIVSLYKNEDVEMLIDKLFNEYPTAIHIINGFNTPIEKKIEKRIFALKSKRAIIMTERPVQMGNWLEQIIRKIYYSFKYTNIHHRLKPVTAGVLPLGRLGAKVFKGYGWDNAIVFPFMYCPPLNDLVFSIKKRNPDEPIKMLYVGRFYYKTKGVDILLQAIKRIKGNFVFDFVGGYGDNKEQVLAEIERDDRLNFIGTWPSSQVGANMQNYDLVVIPSRYDGWNLLVNEAINAGVPVITTDGAVSDEVISRFNCGVVVRHSNSKHLASAMQYILDNPGCLISMQNNTREALQHINETTVGQYLIDIINYLFYNRQTRPICPWH